ncbi:MAG: sensor histidine kinase, partial [Rhodospirillales bacterium]
LAALGQMSAGLSHELNQPLAAIRSYADNAGAFLDRGREETARRNLKGISELTVRMARIIKNLRTFAREESVALRPSSLATAIQESLTLLERRLQAEGVQVDIRLPEGDVTVMGGDVRLQQIFVNLISNALDAMDMASSPERRLVLAAEARGAEALVTVGDSGPGIDAARSNDAFYTTKEVGQGTGLGLSITFGLVNQFGGTITAGRDEELGGARFTLTLRLAEERREAVA